MRLEHVGIAVSRIESALTRYQTLLGKAPYRVESVPEEGVTTHFFAAGEVKIELLEATSESSPVTRFLEKRGPGLHHLAFRVEDLESTAERLLRDGFEIVGRGPSDGADQMRIFFLHPRDLGGVLVECCQELSEPELSNRAAGADTNRRVEIFTDDHHRRLALQLARRLEPDAEIVLRNGASSTSDGTERSVLESTGVNSASRNTRSHACRFIHRLSFGAGTIPIVLRSVPPTESVASWIHITSASTGTPPLDSGRPENISLFIDARDSGRSRPSLPGELPANAGDPDDHVAEGDNCVSVPHIELPVSALCPTQPAFDALAPLVRGHWAEMEFDGEETV